MKKSATQVIDRVDVRYSKLTVLNTLADEEVSAFDVLDAFMMFRIVGEIDGAGAALLSQPQARRSHILVTARARGSSAADALPAGVLVGDGPVCCSPASFIRK